MGASGLTQKTKFRRDLVYLWKSKTNSYKIKLGDECCVLTGSVKELFQSHSLISIVTSFEKKTGWKGKKNKKVLKKLRAWKKDSSSHPLCITN